jgi:pyruvate dehydrogenase E2 component (dihydrolipoamide acetyltransferase)
VPSVFRLPDLGEGLTEAQLVKWLVTQGQAVEVNQPLCEVETAKALVEIPAPWAGKVEQLHARPGETVPVGSPLVTIAQPAGAESAAAPKGGVLVGYGPGGVPETPVRRRRRAVEAAAAGSDAEDSDDGAGSDVRATPVVRKRARELGVDLRQVQGSGPGGRIVREDLERLGAAAAPRPGGDGDERISVVGIRKAIARRMLQSVATIPHFTEFGVFDATALAARREALQREGVRATPLAFFVAATVSAVQRFPIMNSSWQEATDEILVRRQVHVGIATDTPRGLLVPVLRDAQQLRVKEIAMQAADLVARAQAGTLAPAQMSGSTITITNVGAKGAVLTGVPLINPPECCVVGFGAITPQALVVDSAVVARPAAWISISADHRIVDGAAAAGFLAAIVAWLEAPEGHDF